MPHAHQLPYRPEGPSRKDKAAVETSMWIGIWQGLVAAVLSLFKPCLYLINVTLLCLRAAQTIPHPSSLGTEADACPEFMKPPPPSFNSLKYPRHLQSGRPACTIWQVSMRIRFVTGRDVAGYRFPTLIQTSMRKNPSVRILSSLESG
jgi:hypothetical protein